VNLAIDAELTQRAVIRLPGIVSGHDRHVESIWPADMAIDWPVSWVLSLSSLTQDEKEAILYKNLATLLGMAPA
jgi:hypothetical protein